MKLRYETLKLSIFSILFFLVLFSIDYFFLTEINAYQGYVNNFSWDKLFVAFITILMLNFLLPKSQEHGKKFFFLLVVFFSFLPYLVHFVITADYFYYVVVLSSTLIILSMTKFGYLPYFSVANFSEKHIMYFLLFFISIITLYVIANGGLRYWNLNIADVYLYRRDAAANLPGFMGYIISSIAKVLLPCLLILALKHKSYLILFCGFILIIFQFGLFAHKESLFNGLVALLIFYAAQKNILFKSTLYGMVVLVSISLIDIILYSLSKSEGWIVALFANRTLLIPPLLTEMYIQYFSDSNLYMWCYSKFTLGLLECKENITPPFVIGREYFGNEEMSANVGIVGSGFANLHYFGVLLYSFFVGLSILILNSFSKKVGYPMVVAMSMLIIFNQLTSTDFLTSLLSNGLILSVMILMLLPDSKS